MATPTTETRGDSARSNSWMDEQAAEYADLVGSFVESVHDQDTDEMLEYQLIWEGGDLGVALTPIESATEAKGVMVSRVTGKGFPFGIKNVGSGDILLSINLHDTTKMTLDQVVAYLQECDLPATLRFKKVSPDMDRAVGPPAVPRTSQFVITSDNTPTSPVGSQRPSAASVGSGRHSVKSVISVGTYQQQHQQQLQQRGSHRFSNASSRPSMQNGRASMASQPRPSDLHSRPSDLPPRPSDPYTAAPPTAPTPVMAKRQPSGLPAAPAPTPVPAPVPVQQTPAPAPAPAPTPAPAPATRTPPRPVPAPVAAPSQSPAVVSQPSVIQKQPVPVQADTMAKDVALLNLGSGSDADRESWDVDEERSSEEEDDMPVPDVAQVPQTRQKHAESVAMLGNYSTEANGIPILPQESMSVIMTVDGVHSAPATGDDFVESDDDASPIGHAVQPVNLRGSSQQRVSTGSADIPRESVRLTIDGGAGAPMMKGQPLSALHELCAKGNLRGVVQHLKVNGPDALIHREPNHGQTCLHLAVKSGNVQLAKHILEQYEPAEEIVNLEDDKGNTALHFAATKTPGMVHLLLENGGSANVKNSRKLTPLIISVITSKDDNVIIPRMLLKYGANPNDMHDSHTVIHTAIGSGMLNIAGALVRAGAKMDVEDSEGRSVFEKLDKKSIRFLISHIYFPPTYISEKERTDCMLCQKKIKFGHRKNNCTHCGRYCCTECSSLAVEMYRFPMGFPGRVRKGAAVRDLKKVCKTCYGVFKERGETPEKGEGGGFINRVIGIEWDEVNPNKLQRATQAGRRGEKDY